MITGVIQNASKAYKRKVSVNPIAHHYEKPGEKPYIKYNCPVCEMVGNKVQIPHGIEKCPLCGVSLNWTRKPEVGDVVVICGYPIYGGRSKFPERTQCVIVEDHSNEEEEFPYVLQRCVGDMGEGTRLKYRAEEFTILEEPEDE